MSQLFRITPTPKEGHKIVFNTPVCLFQLLIGVVLTLILQVVCAFVGLEPTYFLDF